MPWSKLIINAGKAEVRLRTARGARQTQGRREGCRQACRQACRKEGRKERRPRRKGRRSPDAYAGCTSETSCTSDSCSCDASACASTYDKSRSSARATPCSSRSYTLTGSFHASIRETSRTDSITGSGRAIRSQYRSAAHCSAVGCSSQFCSSQCGSPSRAKSAVSARSGCVRTLIQKAWGVIGSLTVEILERVFLEYRRFERGFLRT